MVNTSAVKLLFLTLVILPVALALQGCGLYEELETPVPIKIPEASATSVIATVDKQPSLPTKSTGTGEPQPSERPTVQVTYTPTAVLEDEDQTLIDEQGYLVVYVDPGDVLNVRSGPGVTNDIIGTLLPGAKDVQIVGESQVAGRSEWMPVHSENVDGWVNGRFLSRMVPGSVFCQDLEVKDMIANLKTAVEDRDNEALANLVDEARGLRIRRHWWNPEVRLEGDDLFTFFTSDKQSTWGIEDGSGRQIIGSVSEVIVPLLDKNLLGSSDQECNEILHGGTAGMIKLPDEYQGINFYSLYRPPNSPETELDWGTWVVGIERLRGRYFISFLVHYQWEI